MERYIKYKVKAGLKIVGAFLFVGFLASCSSYKVLNIDVLHPGELNVGNKNAQILFIDRKLVHESDSLSAYQLFASLRLRRDEVVNHFYNGVRDGLRNGVQPILLVKGLGLNRTGIPLRRFHRKVLPHWKRFPDKHTFSRWNIVSSGWMVRVG